MRFDTPIFFQEVIEGELDPNSGDYAEEGVSETKKDADVTDSGIETLNIVYGCIRQGCKTIRLLNHYTDSFDYIRIGNKRYRVDFERKLRTKHVFVVSEVQ